ncbi:MAG: hypothetical protein DCC75_04830 [Proteobacteria bacterium]|nr:MAG: hypothetical protein DCC75_04830 [Pseudomonadota bacterium]
MELTHPEQNLSDPHFQSRSEIIKSIRGDAVCDILVIGGGIQGATFAHLAAFNGFRTVLLERDDYACGTSSRSSKIVHGGLRYLANFDFRQVLDGLHCREDLLQVAAHLVRPHSFALAVDRGANLERLKLQLGVTLYRLLSTLTKSRRALPAPALLEDPEVRSRYTIIPFEDALMDDARLVIERIIAARQEGARCLNYAQVMAHYRRQDGTHAVKWRETGLHSDAPAYELNAGVIVNCAGQWASQVEPVLSRNQKFRLVYSRGAHLLFSKPWRGPVLVRQAKDGRGRVYFIMPHFCGASAGTLVGTTEREISAEQAQLGTASVVEAGEAQELLEALERDFPSLALDRSSLFYGFAGVRTMVAAKGERNIDTAKLSRRHLWVESGGVLSLLGGKYTTARSIAEDGLRRLLKITQSKLKLTSLRGRLLAGGGVVSQEFSGACRENSVAETVIQACIQRFGSRVREMLAEPGLLQVVAGQVLQGEIELAIKHEQACTLDDLLSRRFGLEYTDGHGIAAAQQLCDSLGLGSGEAERQIGDYKAKIERGQALT